MRHINILFLALCLIGCGEDFGPVYDVTTKLTDQEFNTDYDLYGEVYHTDELPWLIVYDNSEYVQFINCNITDLHPGIIVRYSAEHCRVVETSGGATHFAYIVTKIEIMSDYTEYPVREN